MTGLGLLRRVCDIVTMMNLLAVCLSVCNAIFDTGMQLLLFVYVSVSRTDRCLLQGCGMDKWMIWSRTSYSEKPGMYLNLANTPLWWTSLRSFEECQATPHLNFNMCTFDQLNLHVRQDNDAPNSLNGNKCHVDIDNRGFLDPMVVVNYRVYLQASANIYKCCPPIWLRLFQGPQILCQ